MDDAQSELPEAIVVFVDGEHVHTGRTWLVRGDVAARLQTRAVDESGFEFEFPKSLVDLEASPQLRVFAVSSSGRATELLPAPEDPSDFLPE